MGDRGDLDRLHNLCCSRRALEHRHILCGVAGVGRRRRRRHRRVREDRVGVHGRLAGWCEADGGGVWVYVGGGVSCGDGERSGGGGM